LPEQLDVRNEAGHEDKVERAAADDLIGDAQFAALGVPGFRWRHGVLPACRRADYRTARKRATGFRSARHYSARLRAVAAQAGDNRLGLARANVAAVPAVADLDGTAVGGLRDPRRATR